MGKNGRIGCWIFCVLHPVHGVGRGMLLGILRTASADAIQVSAEANSTGTWPISVPACSSLCPLPHRVQQQPSAWVRSLGTSHTPCFDEPTECSSWHVKSTLLCIYHAKVMYSYHMRLTTVLQKQFELKWFIFFAFPINLKQPLFSGGEATIQIPIILIAYSLSSWPPVSTKVKEKGDENSLMGFVRFMKTCGTCRPSASLSVRAAPVEEGRAADLTESGFLLPHLQQAAHGIPSLHKGNFCDTLLLVQFSRVD